MLVYAKSESFINGLLPRSIESTKRYSNPDDDPRGPWKPVDYWNQASPSQRPNLTYDIINPNTSMVISPTNKAWKYSKKVHEEHVADNRIWWGKDGKNTVPALKRFLSEVSDGLIPHNWWTHKEVGHTDEAKKEILNMFDGKEVFDTPKPTRLIKRAFQIANLNEDNIVLDFFSGSGTFAHALLDMSKESNMRLNFICIQLPEVCNPKSAAFKAGYETIAEIGKERIRRVIQQQDNQDGLGFKVYKLAASTIRKWSNIDQSHGALSAADAQMDLFIKAPLVDGTQPQDFVTEIMLLQGFPLTARQENVSDAIVRVTHTEVPFVLYVAWAKRLTEALLEPLSLQSTDHFVCLDLAFGNNNSLKQTLSNHCHLLTI